jgi:hypothetical protein
VVIIPNYRRKIFDERVLRRCSQSPISRAWIRYGDVGDDASQVLSQFLFRLFVPLLAAVQHVISSLTAQLSIIRSPLLTLTTTTVFVMSFPPFAPRMLMKPNLGRA